MIRVRLWPENLSQEATRPDYRGCVPPNAAIEYTERKHLARLVAATNKRKFRVEPA